MSCPVSNQVLLATVNSISTSGSSLPFLHIQRPTTPLSHRPIKTRSACMWWPSAAVSSRNYRNCTLSKGWTDEAKRLFCKSTVAASFFPFPPHLFRFSSRNSREPQGNLTVTKSAHGSGTCVIWRENRQILHLLLHPYTVSLPLFF